MKKMLALLTTLSFLFSTSILAEQVAPTAPTTEKKVEETKVDEKKVDEKKVEKKKKKNKKGDVKTVAADLDLAGSEGM